MTITRPSPFFAPGSATTENSLVIISLKRDQQIPAVLQSSTPSKSEDTITNTRFGSFPHSTLLNQAWGSQVIASNVNAQSARKGKKRKREDNDGQDKVNEDDEDGEGSLPAFEAAASGFAHVLPPTPELWTVSLPHRTQVVYTPDYSFILQQLRVRPGDSIIEAGAGSGSFTHAAARAVFSGHTPDSTWQENGRSTKRRKRLGQVYSFEYHEPRYQEICKEVVEHGLSGIVTATHRDVYADGFTLSDPSSPIRANAVFLDLPAPWLALPHLSRGPPTSPLNPKTTTHLCTFSPCIEQVQRTIEKMRELGWVDIHMFEVSHKRIDVRRELISLDYEGLRGVNASAASVDEALARLRELEGKGKVWHGKDEKKGKKANKEDTNGKGVEKERIKEEAEVQIESRKERLARIKEQDKDRKAWKEGRLVHRSESELKTHTSYLTFALLPRAWSAEDEEKARSSQVTGGKVGKKQ
ncbi:tRNA methyltransferase complex GCD14 subunit [Venturia nashicola]|nr:tRNA methyltransferase complex GCD14 subunit [Venturia nashicola]